MHREAWQATVHGFPRVKQNLTTKERDRGLVEDKLFCIIHYVLCIMFKDALDS